MKRIIAPLALALLSTVAFAETDFDDLPAWNNVNYKNFTKKTIPFDKLEDCVIARDYAMTRVNGKLIINKRDTTDNKLYSTARTVDNNIETRIRCKLVYKSLESMIATTSYRKPPTFDFHLVYETATKRSNNEIREIEIEQSNAKKQYDDNIKSKVNDALNLE